MKHEDVLNYLEEQIKNTATSRKLINLRSGVPYDLMNRLHRQTGMRVSTFMQALNAINNNKQQRQEDIMQTLARNLNKYFSTSVRAFARKVQMDYWTILALTNASRRDTYIATLDQLANQLDTTIVELLTEDKEKTL